MVNISILNIIPLPSGNPEFIPYPRSPEDAELQVSHGMKPGIPQSSSYDIQH
jgi:hypothetical protein